MQRNRSNGELYREGKGKEEGRKADKRTKRGERKSGREEERVWERIEAVEP